MSALHKIFVLICFSLFITGCSNDDGTTSDDTGVVTPPVVDPTDDDTEEEETTDDGDGNTDDGTTDDDGTIDKDSFSFDDNLVMEHSYNTGGCTPGPCDTVDESLNDVFDNGQPDDAYFYRSDDGTVLNLKCQLDEGRRTEFKQVSEGSLMIPSRIEFEASYFDIPTEGITIAQVHNRGGSSNKPFFRLELYSEGLDTVVRQDPTVNSTETFFDTNFYPFNNETDYNEEPLSIIIEKGNGVVHLMVVQEGVTLIDETYAPDSNTNWVTDTGIANGFYLKAGIYNPAAAHTRDIEMEYTKFTFTSEDDN